MRQRPLSEPTIEWMAGDIADRCRSVLQSLDSPTASGRELEAAAGLLRSAADDLVSLVELIDGHGAAVRAGGGSTPLGSFDLAFRPALRSSAELY